MFETAIALLCAHLFSDGINASHWLLADKTRPWGLALSMANVAGWAGLALGGLDLSLLTLLVLSHLTVETAKSRWPEKTRLSGLSAFSLEQALRLAILAVLVSWRPDAAAQGIWGHLSAPVQAYIWAGMAAVSGAILAVHTGGRVMKLVTAPLAPRAPIGGLDMGGRYIGWLERGLTFLFVLYGHPEGVGFLLTAKSIFRFGDITDASKRENTEYIIIGTMASFGWGLIIAILTAAAVHHWLA